VDWRGFHASIRRGPIAIPPWFAQSYATSVAGDRRRPVLRTGGYRRVETVV